MNFELPSIVVKMPPLIQLVDLGRLQQQAVRLEARIEGHVNAALRDRLAETRYRLRACVHPRSAATFDERFLRAIDEIGRERLLLKLYLLDEGEASVRQYLPPFDEVICTYLFRADSPARTQGALRTAATLFFNRFDLLAGCGSLGFSLVQSIGEVASDKFMPGRLARWHVNRDWIFGTDGPQQLVSRRHKGETLKAAAERSGVPNPSRYFDVAQQHHLFVRLQNLALGEDDDELFGELVAAREQPLATRELIGTRALQILIRRSLNENRGHLPESWGKRVLLLGCDPRLSRRSDAFRRWWSWANDNELAVVLRWFTGAELGKFLYLLESSLGPDGRRMFERRKAVLLKLFKADKISDARLAVVNDAMHDARRHFRDNLGSSFASLASGSTSVICLRVENFYIVEGTHNFALRLYRQFPVAGFWERTRSQFNINEFKDGLDQPPISPIRHQGDWELKFENALMQHFRVRWFDA